MPQESPLLAPAAVAQRAVAAAANVAQLNDAADALALAAHAVFVSLGFRLVGLGEHNVLENINDDDSSPPLPATFNAFGDVYSLRYRHAQSALTFLLKIVASKGQCAVTGIALEHDQTFQHTLDLAEHIAATFPAKLAGDQDFLRLYAPGKLESLVLAIKTHIVQKLIPGLHKEGYEESRTIASSGTQTDQQQPRRDYPAGGFPAGHFASPPSAGFFPRPPGTIGDVDLDPFAAAPGVNPRFPPAGLGGMHPGGGMIVGPDHPMFTGDEYGGFEPQYPGGIPFSSVPPGARFDPVGPLGPRPGMPRGVRGRGRGQGGFGDEFGPPGFDNPFGGPFG